MSRPVPDLVTESRLLAQGATSVAGIDEVGRGAWAGPVSVGVVLLVDASTPAPDGLRDSKLLSARMRQRLAPLVSAWATTSAVGHASPAASRALEDLDQVPDAVIVDGPLDLLFPTSEALSRAVANHRWRQTPPTVVEAVIRADQTCASVAAASVVAKVARDALMVELAESFPAYDLDHNVGYPSPAHQTALRGYGLTPLHRRSWKFTETVPWERTSDARSPQSQR